MTIPAAELTDAEPDFTDRPGLAVVPPLVRRARQVPASVVVVAALLAVTGATAVRLAGLFGVAVVIATLIVGSLARDRVRFVLRRRAARRG